MSYIKSAATGRFSSVDPMEHFNARYMIDIKTGCWEWTAGKFQTGYGYFKCKALGKPMAASRASWLLNKGPLTSVDHVLHSCDNRGCVNPDHLFVGPPKDNVHDMMNKDRISWGEGRPAAKLTEEDVRAIREARANGQSGNKLAAQYGVGKNTIYRAASGETWRRVTA